MSDANEPSKPAAPRPGRARRVLAGAALAAGVAAVLYGVVAPGKTGPAACPAAAAATARLDPLIRGEVAAMSLAQPARIEPDVAFRTPDGRPTSLADFKGKALLVNLWATWCVPCRKEMPALDALQRSQGGPDFQVVAVNVDTARLDRPAEFLKQNGIADLALFADPSADILQALKRQGGLLGLPTTLLIDRNGCELGRMAGPAEWASPDGQAVIRALKG
ncbi:TlpA family protein disulfide reductase [Lichenibacterium minor]|jgi:thiol-disulfide isomerase/thioredoxin|uniref:TlpA family protein disulfide reductase n=1 Tax=Lichenibacterium minor TaxID=2316528 RepID=A0A4Q2UAK0_9HYPH|nr:TlpA disulfide reductase family protein [Lichenibacterium minor]RYC32988.1 TlpA family protein disulfide reductase [Lichenibacterium minor]